MGAQNSERDVMQTAAIDSDHKLHGHKKTFSKSAQQTSANLTAGKPPKNQADFLSGIQKRQAARDVGHAGDVHDPARLHRVSRALELCGGQASL